MHGENSIQFAREQTGPTIQTILANWSVALILVMSSPAFDKFASNLTVEFFGFGLSLQELIFVSLMY